jgi:hypothetical protein
MLRGQKPHAVIMVTILPVVVEKTIRTNVGNRNVETGQCETDDKSQLERQ